MGILPWVMGILILISCTSWLHMRKLVETVFVVQADIEIDTKIFHQRFQPIEMRSKLLYESLVAKKKPTSGSDTGLTISQTLSPANIRTAIQPSEEIVPHESALPKQQGRSSHELMRSQPQLRLTRSLHLNELFSERGETSTLSSASPTSTDTRKDLEKALLVRLLQTSYRDIPALISPDPRHQTDTADSFYESLVSSLMEEISRVREKLSVREISRLANIELDDERMAYTLFHVLQGGSASSSNTIHTFPPLTHLISTRRRATVASLYLAPVPILRVLCESDDAVLQVIHERKEIYKKMRAMKGSNRLSQQDRALLQEEFKSRTSPYIDKSIDLQFIDFSISLTKPS